MYYIKVTSADIIIRMINDTINYNIKMYYIPRTNYQLPMIFYKCDQKETN